MVLMVLMALFSIYKHLIQHLIDLVPVLWERVYVLYGTVYRWFDVDVMNRLSGWNWRRGSVLSA